MCVPSLPDRDQHGCYTGRYSSPCGRLAPSNDPIVATVPALEFVKLLEADVVPTGIAVGVHYEWLKDGMGPDNLQVRVEGVGRALGTAADTGSSRATKERL